MSNMDWSTLPSLLQADSPIPTDVKFKVMDEEGGVVGLVEAHRLLLAANSQFFQKAFFGSGVQLQANENFQIYYGHFKSVCFGQPTSTRMKVETVVDSNTLGGAPADRCQPLYHWQYFQVPTQLAVQVVVNPTKTWATRIQIYTSIKNHDSKSQPNPTQKGQICFALHTETSFGAILV